MQSGAGNFCGVYHASRYEVFKHQCVRVETLAARCFFHLAQHDRSSLAGVFGYLFQRGCESFVNNVQPGSFVAIGFEVFDNLSSAERSHAATWEDALFDSCSRSMQCVFDAGFDFLHLAFGRSSDIYSSHAACELGQAFLEFFAVVIAGGGLYLVANLCDSALDISRRASPLDNGRVVVVDTDSLGCAKVCQLDRGQVYAQVFAENLRAGQHGDVVEHSFSAVAIARSLDSTDIQNAAELVDHQRSQGFAIDIFADNQQLFFSFGSLLQQRDDLGDAGNFFLVYEDERLVHDAFHRVGVGDEVRAEVASVELHALDHIDVRIDALAFFDSDNAIASDLGHSFS